MANPIRPLDRSAENFVQGTQAAGERYIFGVNNPKRNWKANTEAAAERHKQAMAEAAARNAFAKGVARTSQTDWQTATATKGATRWPEGVAGSREKWARRFAPYHAALGNQTLPPRGPRRSPQNLARMTANVKTMVDTFNQQNA